MFEASLKTFCLHLQCRTRRPCFLFCLPLPPQCFLRDLKKKHSQKQKGFVSFFFYEVLNIENKSWKKQGLFFCFQANLATRCTKVFFLCQSETYLFEKKKKSSKIKFLRQEKKGLICFVEAWILFYFLRKKNLETIYVCVSVFF